MKHIIKLNGNDDRDYWECDCGQAGNTAAGRGESHSQVHISEGDLVSYRYPGSATTWSA